jgi:cytochrome c-type biogenesis protein CcmH
VAAGGIAPGMTTSRGDGATLPWRKKALAAAVVMLALVMAVLVAWQAARSGRTPGASSQPTASTSPAGSEGGRLGAAELRRRVEHDPRDGRGWALLAYAEFEADRFAEAAAAFERAVEVSPKVAGDAGVWCDWADALGMAQGGSLAGRPTELVARALALRPSHPKALEMAGSAAYERRDFAAAAEYWRRLLPQLGEDRPSHQALSAAIARADRLAAMSLPMPAPR